MNSFSLLLHYCRPKNELSMDTKPAGVKNPEKRAKAAYVTIYFNTLINTEILFACLLTTPKLCFGCYSYAEFQEREIPLLREERPGLRLSQYKVRYSQLGEGWAGLEMC